LKKIVQPKETFGQAEIYEKSNF